MPVRLRPRAPIPPAQTLKVQLHQAHESGVWDACLARFVNPKLLMIDEFGYLPVPPRTAILDRLLHHSQVITIQVDSYRLRKKRRAGMVSSREPNTKGGTIS